MLFIIKKIFGYNRAENVPSQIQSNVEGIEINMNLN